MLIIILRRACNFLELNLIILKFNFSDYVSEKFQFYALHRCMFVLFFAQAKDQAYPGDIHHVMKYCEQKYGELDFGVLFFKWENFNSEEI